MKSFAYKIRDEFGIHARPAGVLVKLASGFTSEITVKANGKTASLKKLFALMSMGIKKDEVIELEIDGADESEAYNALSGFFNDNL